MKTIVWTVIAVVGIAFGGGLIYINSGSFDVAATSKDPGWLAWTMRTTREHSIERRAEDVEPPADNVLTDPNNIKAGFEHYDQMCVGCHLAPGFDSSDIREGLNPKPPQLAKRGKDLSPREAFWIIKHGIEMTGMPAWGPTHSDNKLWQLVAFVKKLPEISAADYKAMRQEATNAKVSHTPNDLASSNLAH
jgi:mono/diheme cytochrome c family protein